VFTARYALSAYIKQIRFVFKGLKWRYVVTCWGLLTDVAWILHDGEMDKVYRILVEKSRSKVKQSHYRPGQAVRVPGGRGSQIFIQSAREGGKVVSLTHHPPLPAGNIPDTNFCRSWVDPRAIVRPKGPCQ
jgi:hypothetical protein